MGSNIVKKKDVELNSGLQAFEAKHFSRAMQLLSPLAEDGNTEAQHRCAIMYQNGLGNKENPLLAYKWMKKAAENGHALAQHGLGFMFMEGDCVEKNGEQAVYWFTKAAEQGLAGSLTTLAMIYEEGKLVEKDIEKSKKLLEIAGF
ncbi:MAG: tetratricopeptide repeat protein [Pseudomonadota bacterium]|nr:tetratricopeptide repeat protein [Pseudomonadota bacterium]|tara:strand:- start:1607 stop:2044 length:438 start_codon:yes stop_codon:yes gene_type:complete